MARQKFTWKSFLIRLVAALTLVFASYNPSGYSYYHWTISHWMTTEWDITVFKAFVGVVVIIGWTIFIRATFRSLGVVGTTLAIAFFGLLIWLVVDIELVAADDIELTYLLLIGLSGVLAAGLSWSHVRRRVTGQLDVDDVD